MLGASFPALGGVEECLGLGGAGAPREGRGHLEEPWGDGAGVRHDEPGNSLRPWTCSGAQGAQCGPGDTVDLYNVTRGFTGVRKRRDRSRGHAHTERGAGGGGTRGNTRASRRGRGALPTGVWGDSLRGSRVTACGDSSRTPLGLTLGGQDLRHYFHQWGQNCASVWGRQGQPQGGGTRRERAA